MELHDINKLPSEEGILRFPISMARISNAQTPETYIDYIRHFNEKVSLPRIGITILYTEFLYLYSEKGSAESKKTFGIELVKHINGFKKIIKKPYLSVDKKNHVFLIQNAFSFQSWVEQYMKYPSFFDDLQKLRNIYNKDEIFQRYVEEDASFSKKKLDENQIMFFLEEHLMSYLVAKGKISQNNEYVPNYKRTLVCYPGPMLKQHIYLLQKNFFKLENKENKYENCWYNLEGKKLYDAMKIDLEKYNYEN